MSTSIEITFPEDVTLYGSVGGASGSVHTSDIADGSVTADKLHTDSVTSAAIATGAVDSDELATGAVTTGKLDGGAVTTAKLGTGAVTADKLGADSVYTAALQDGAVTDAKLAQTGGVLSDVALLEDYAALKATASPEWLDDGSRGVYYTTGELKGATNFNHTTYVDVSGLSRITYSRVCSTSTSGTFGMAFYDSSYTYVSGERTVLAAESYAYTSSTIEVPTTAKYARFTIFNGNSGVSGSFTLTGVPRITSELGSLDTEVDGLLDITGLVSWSSGYITTSGTFSSNAQYNNFSCGRISHRRFDRIILHIPADRQCTVATYDPITRAFVARTSQMTDTTYVVDNTHDVIITVATTYKTTAQEDSQAQVLAAVRVHGTWHRSRWAGKSAAFVGDSITYGVNVGSDSAVYWRRLAAMLELSSVTGQGVAGSCWSVTSGYGTAHSPIAQRWGDIPTTADLVCVFAGTNDWGHDTPIGTLSDTTDVSFCGAIASVIEGVIGANPDVRLVLISPLHRWGFESSYSQLYDNMQNNEGHTLADYADALKDVAASYGIPVIDGFSTGIAPRVSAFRDAYVTDGLHPNDAGHGLLAEALYSSFEAL